MWQRQLNIPDQRKKPKLKQCCNSHVEYVKKVLTYMFKYYFLPFFEEK